MKLVDLIEFLKDQDILEQLFEKENLNTDSGAINICMKRALDIESDIGLIEMEKTGGNLSFEINDIPYVELFPAYHAMEIVESYFGGNIGSRYNNLEIAKRLLEYRIKDA
ncbi:MAG TPA: hypothetical protein VGM41_06705 [Chitinophagaceae bacterium]|jgi:hypothetical protein